MAKFRLGDVAFGKPADPGVYEVEIVSLKEKEFNSGAWGFKAVYKIVTGQAGEGTRIFENLVIQDEDGAQSGAAFRFAQLAVAAYASEDLECDLEEQDEVVAIAEGLIGKHVIVTLDIEPKSEDNPRDRNIVTAVTAVK